MEKKSFLVNATLRLLFFILFFYGLIMARNFLYPLLLGVLFAYLLYPLESFLEHRIKIPRILANFISIVIGLVIISLGVSFIYSQMAVFVEDLPKLSEQAIKNIRKLELGITKRIGIAPRENGFIQEGVSALFASGTEFIGAAFTATAGTITKIALLPVYVFLFLYYRNKLKEFLLRLVPSRSHDKAEIIINDISRVSMRYMGGIFIVVTILCVINSAGLLIIGLQYAILLGIISALCNFIPYFGTLIGGIFPLLVAILFEDHPKYVVGVIIFYLFVQFTENNILTPNIVGGQVRINPLVVILSIIMGGMIWGLPGMFMVVPVMAVLKILCVHFEPLAPYAFLLGPSGTEEHSLTYDKIKGFFKRGK